MDEGYKAAIVGGVPKSLIGMEFVLKKL